MALLFCCLKFEVCLLNRVFSAYYFSQTGCQLELFANINIVHLLYNGSCVGLFENIHFGIFSSPALCQW